MINAKLQNLYNIKNDIGTAIVNKGGTITESTPFYSYAGQIDSISTGTPQTVFQDSTGAKWARTNVVNLTNVSNNVTSDFNWWQPANNTTSDAILNVGTVNGNISGNIRIVQVNQVNQAQYSNVVINDTTGAKYVGYNGYDATTNPTPTGNVVFNRWVLNNSASGTVIFSNTTVVNGGTFNGPNISLNISDMAFVGNTASYGASIEALKTNNGFLYVGGFPQTGVNRGVSKFHESNLTLSGNTINYGDPPGAIKTMTINNGSIYTAGSSGGNERIYRFGESNLAFVNNTAFAYGGTINELVSNNGFLYIGGYGPQTLQKIAESNLALISNTTAYGGGIEAMTVNNGFVFIGGDTNQTIKKYHESNLAFSANSPNFNSAIFSLVANNGFIYAGGGGNQTIKKYHESNLALNSNVFYNSFVLTMAINNGFLYVGGYGPGFGAANVSKYYESNLTFVGNTASYGGVINSITINNGFIYVGGVTNRTVQKYNEQTLTLDNQTFYTATKIKE
jgi:hypothetical protein